MKKQYLYLSTSHLSETGATRLTVGDALPFRCETSGNGFLLFVPETPTGLPALPEFAAILDRARDEGCDLVWLDVDGPVLPDLVAFAW